jgi:hypothetical protein
LEAAEEIFARLARAEKARWLRGAASNLRDDFQGIGVVETCGSNAL